MTQERSTFIARLSLACTMRLRLRLAAAENEVQIPKRRQDARDVPAADCESDCNYTIEQCHAAVPSILATNISTFSNNSCASFDNFFF